MRLTRTENAYTSSTTSADAPPPPLQTPPTPYFQFFCLSTCSNISLNDDGKKTIFTRWCIRCFWEHTPKSVTKIRAPLQPRGCPKATAPPWTLTLSCKQDQKNILINKWTILKNLHMLMHRQRKTCANAQRINFWGGELTGFSPSNFWFARATTYKNQFGNSI